MKKSLLYIILLSVCNYGYALKIDQITDLIGHESEVTSIDLSNKGLIEFPIEILKCNNLVELDLSNNGIIKLPMELALLEHLKKLNLSDNQGLSFSDFDAVLGKSEFLLTDLNLANCEMLFVPTKIGLQHQLVNVNLENNRLRSLPYHMIQLSKMESLNLSNNNLEDISWQVNQWWGLKDLNVSGNPRLKTDELIVSLSYTDGLDKLEMSDLSFLPKEFEYLNVDELILKDAQINQFPRSESSSIIRKLFFDKCDFQNPQNIVDVLNNFVQPEFLAFEGINTSQLLPFLAVDVDSVSIQNNGLGDLRPLALKKELVWLDVRRNRLNKEYTKEFMSIRPEVVLFVEEPLAPNKGVSPPIDRFTQAPLIEVIDGGKAQEIELGQSTVRFQENSFVDQDGNSYTGDVELAYTEYFDPVEIMLSGITMASDSANENVMFSSAGMFNLTAQDDKGNPLELANGKPAEISMFSTTAESDVNLYALNEEGDWEYEGKDEIIEPFKIDLFALDSAMASSVLNIKEERIILEENRFVPKVKRNGSEKSFDIKFSELKSLMNAKGIRQEDEKLYVKRNDEVASLVAQTSFVYDGSADSLNYYMDALKHMRKKSKKMYRRLPKNTVKGELRYGSGINYIKGLDIIRNPITDNLRLTFFYKDSLVAIPVVLKSDAGNSRSRMTVFQRFFKRYDRQKMKRSKVWRAQNKVLSKRIKMFEDYLKSCVQQMEVMRQLENYNRASSNKMVGNGSVKRGFAIPRFGIWNCDARSRMVKPFILARNFVAKGGNKLIESVNRMMVVDFDQNGVINFDKGKNGFFDRASNSAIVVFLVGGSVGIYHHVKNKILGDKEALELEVIDVDGMNREELIGRIRA